MSRKNKQNRKVHVRIYPYGTTLSHATSLQQPYPTNNFDLDETVHVVNLLYARSIGKFVLPKSALRKVVTMYIKAFLWLLLNLVDSYIVHVFPREPL